MTQTEMALYRAGFEQITEGDQTYWRLLTDAGVADDSRVHITTGHPA